jgi:hypothetical protein
MALRAIGGSLDGERCLAQLLAKHPLTLDNVYNSRIASLLRNYKLNQDLT